MNIQGLWGISPYEQYSLDKRGVKSRADDAGFLLKENDKASGGKADPAEFAHTPVTGSNITSPATANTLWQTQYYAQSEDADAIDVEIDNQRPVQTKSAAEQFLDHMNKTPEELMREEVLKSLGYTEEELAAMDPKERAKAEAKIKDAIETKIEEALREKGIDIDTANIVSLETA